MGKIKNALNLINKEKIHLLVFIIIFVIPFLFTLAIKSKVSFTLEPLSNFSKLEEYFEDNAWLFSLLKLGPELPYFKVAPDTNSIEPAVLLTYNIGWTQKISYDSLSCLKNALNNINQKQVLNLKDIDWSNCKFVKNFSWGYASSDKNPRIKISIGYFGFFIIYFALVAIWNGFLILLIEVWHRLTGLLNKFFLKKA